jgi:DNA-binding CsgD family transcriptional regulator
VAGQLSRRALDLMPPGDPGRGALVAETTGYLVQAGQAAEAVRLITASAGDLADPAAEAEARLSLAVILMQYAPADVVEQCRRALDLPGVPAALRVQLLSVLSFGLDILGDAAAAAGPAAAAAETARASGDPADEVITLVPRAVNALAVGDWRAAITLVSEAAARRHTVTGVALRLAHPEASKGMTLIAVGRLEEAFALTDSGMRAAQRDGIAANVRLWTMIRCRALYSAGRLADARAEAEAAIEMADEIGDGTYGYVNHMGLYILARVALHTGDAAGLSQARASAARLGRAPGCPASQRLGAWLTALVAQADGDAAAAAAGGAAELDLLGDGPLPGSSPRMYADSAAVTRILLDAGREEDARSVVGRLEAFVAAHPDYPGAESAALHARAVLEGDAETALLAVARGDGDPRPLVRAAVLEDAGRLLPAARAKEAVQVLTRALDSYTAAGAERDAVRVRVLIRARGARPPAGGPRSAPEWPELTESEFAVAGMVARGATNREVAERLYLSHHTVNSHLRHVFAKLGIRSRVELARLMAERGMAAERD